MTTWNIQDCVVVTTRQKAGDFNHLNYKKIRIFFLLIINYFLQKRTYIWLEEIRRASAFAFVRNKNHSEANMVNVWKNLFSFYFFLLVLVLWSLCSQLENVTVKVESLIINRPWPKSLQQIVSYSYLTIILNGVVTKIYSLLKSISITFFSG